MPNSNWTIHIEQLQFRSLSSFPILRHFILQKFRASQENVVHWQKDLGKVNVDKYRLHHICTSGNFLELWFCHMTEKIGDGTLTLFVTCPDSFFIILHIPHKDQSPQEISTFRFLLTVVAFAAERNLGYFCFTCFQPTKLEPHSPRGDYKIQWLTGEYRVKAGKYL